MLGACRSRWFRRLRKARARRASASSISLLSVVLASLFLATSAGAASEDDLTELSLEDLLNIEVTSATKSERRVVDVAAAVYVITAEDIRRSGATTIPDALRLAAGVEVAQIDANKWAISARGSTSRFANKMLVLVDGRTVYTPQFSGVWWNMQDTVLEDIDRIEIIRGPGATLWGANAVNGVINIITKEASRTQGTLVSLSAGTEEKVSASVRHGGEVGSSHYRVWAKYFDRDAFVRPTGEDAADDWSAVRAGFRMDWTPNDRDNVTIQGEAFEGDAGETFTGPILVPPYERTLDDRIDFEGRNVLSRWTRSLAGGSDVTLQVYFDRTDRREDRLGEVRKTFDLDFQHRLKIGDRQELVWGAGYRYTADEQDNGYDLTLTPDSRCDDLASAFIQDEIRIGERGLVLTVGSKFEHNDYSGTEVQPNIRGSWRLTGEQWLWGAISRAVRQPSRALTNGRFDMLAFPDPVSGLPVLVSVFGNPEMEAGNLHAYEVGYRLRPSARASLDVAVFVNEYDDLEDGVLGTPFLETDPVPHVVVPTRIGNLRSLETRGIEITGTWRVSDRWNLSGWVTVGDLNLDEVDDPGTAATISPLTSSAETQAHLRSYLDLPGNTSLDAALYFTDQLDVPDVPSRTRLDLRFAWRPSPDLELSLVGQNLLKERHLERKDFMVDSTEVERGFYGKLTWRF